MPLEGLRSPTTVRMLQKLLAKTEREKGEALKEVAMLQRKVMIRNSIRMHFTWKYFFAIFSGRKYLHFYTKIAFFLFVFRGNLLSLMIS